MSRAPKPAERASRVYRESRRFKREAKDLGLQVRALRQARGWTLEKAAERMHMDLKHLQKIEAGTLNVTLVTLVRIAEGLGAPVGELFASGRDDFPPGSGHARN